MWEATSGRRYKTENIHHEEHEGHEGVKKEFDTLSNPAIGCAIEVHRVLGPGLKAGIRRFVL